MWRHYAELLNYERARSSRESKCKRGEVWLAEHGEFERQMREAKERGEGESEKHKKSERAPFIYGGKMRHPLYRNEEIIWGGNAKTRGLREFELASIAIVSFACFHSESPKDTQAMPRYTDKPAGIVTSDPRGT
jgi:hypothetical protein